MNLTSTVIEREFAPLGVSTSRLKVAEQHAEEAAFLWTQRDHAVDLPQFDLFLLARLDQRVEAHLDGLRVAGSAGWDCAWNSLEEFAEPGSVFAAGVLAFEDQIAARTEAVLAIGAASPALSRALVSALAWVPFVQSGGLIRTLMASNAPIFQRIGLAASVAHRKNPGAEALTDALGSKDVRLKARALRAIGELGLADMHLALRSALKTADPLSRFWAAWSLALINGHADALTYLQAVGESKSGFALKAADMAARRLPGREARAWLMKLVREKNLPRVAIAVAGGLGEPEVVPWLLDQFKMPELARPAAEAFCRVSGAHLDIDHLLGEPPENFESGPNDDPDDPNVALDPDEPLEWPHPTRARGWWDVRKVALAKETRHFLGRPLSVESVREGLRSGYQRQRAAAAIELAILKPGQPLQSVRGPGFVQQAVWNLSSLT